MIDGAAQVDQAFMSYQTAQKPVAARADGKMTAEKAKAVAEDFEAFFISRMVESMFDGIKTDGPFGGGQGERVFRSIMIQEYGKDAAKRGEFGIAEMVQTQLLRLQEVQEK